MAHSTPAPVRYIDHTTDGRWRTAVDAFLAGFRSSATRRTYRQGLEPWLHWCRTLDVDPGDVRRTHIELWLRHLEDRGLAPATQAVRLTAVKSFYAWCYDEAILEGNPAGRVKPPHVPQTHLAALNRHEGHRFLIAAQQLDLQRAAVLTVMIMTGIRVGEACKANVSDVTEERYHFWLHVHGKGQRERRVPLPQTAIGAVHEALEERGWPGPDAPLFVNQAGRRIVRANVARAIRTACRAADIDKKLTPHSLRRSAVSIALEAGDGLREVQRLAGHASSQTTTRYDRRDENPARSPAFSIQSAIA